jgi:hypothetical protein
MKRPDKKIRMKMKAGQSPLVTLAKKMHMRFFDLTNREIE